MAIDPLAQFEVDFNRLATTGEPIRRPTLPTLTGQEAGQQAPAPAPLPPPADEERELEDLYIKLQQDLEEKAPPIPTSQTASAAGVGGAESLADLQRELIAIRGRLAGTQRGEVQGFGTVPEALRYLTRSGVRLGAILATPLIDPLTRGGMTEEQRQLEAGLSTPQKLAMAVGRSQEAASKLLEYIGITPENTPEESSTIMARVGEDLLPAVTAAIGLVRGAPFAARLATYQGRVPLVAGVGRVAGEIAARPVTFTTQAGLSQIPATMLREYMSTTRDNIFGDGSNWPSWSGRFLWDLSMEVLGGGAAARPIHLLTRGLMPKAERFAPFATQPVAIMDRAVDPATAAGVMRVQAATQVDTIDRMVANVIDGIKRGNFANAVDAGREMRAGLLAVRDFAEQQYKDAYAALPPYLNVSMPTRALAEINSQLGRASRFTAEAGNFDAPYLRDIMNQLARKRPNGEIVMDVITGAPRFRDIVGLDELITMRSRLIHKSREAAEVSVRGSQGNRPLKSNLDSIIDALTKDIEEGLHTIDGKYLAQWELANEMYRVYNQRFRQGPVGELLLNTRHHPLARAGTSQPPGSPLIPDARVVAKTLSPDDTADAVAEALMPFFPNHANAINQALMTSVARNTVEDAVRTAFHHELMDVWTRTQEVAKRPAGAAGITGLTYNLAETPARQVTGEAARFVARHEPLLRRWAGLTADMMNTQKQLADLLRQRNDYTQSLVYQFIGRDPAEVIVDAINSPNREHLFRQLHRQFSGHPQALEGVRRALIDHIFSGHGADPSVALERMQTTEMGAILRIMFAGAEDRLARLFDLTKAASSILGDVVSTTAAGRARVDEKGAHLAMGPLRRMMRTATVNMAGWFLGLMTGHHLVRFLNLGSQGALSVPARMSTFMRQAVSSHWIRNQVKALDVIRDAVFEPKFEAWMLNSASGNWQEQLGNFRKLQSTYNTIYRAANEDIERYINGHGRSLAREERARVELEWKRRNENPFKE